MFWLAFLIYTGAVNSEGLALELSRTATLDPLVDDCSSSGDMHNGHYDSRCTSRSRNFSRFVQLGRGFQI